MIRASIRHLTLHGIPGGRASRPTAILAVRSLSRRTLASALVAVPLAAATLLVAVAEDSSAHETQPFAPAAAWIGPQGNTRSVALGDLDRDGDLDLVRGNDSGSGVVVHVNVGGVFSKTDAGPAYEQHTASVAVGDVDGDGDLDIVGGGGGNATFYRCADGVCEVAGTWLEPYQNTLSVALGDVDGDGDLDLVRGNVDSGSTLYLNSSGTFADTPAWTSPDLTNTWSVVLGDVNGDGSLDLICVNNGQPRLYLNAGGTFAETAAWTGPEGGGDVALGDVDGDGDLDLVLGGQPAMLYRNLGGTLDTTPVPIGQRNERTTSVALGDVDGDGDLDLIRGNYGPATLYLNVGGAFPDTMPAWNGPWELTRSVVLGDVDGDGDLDLVRGNYYEQASTLYINTYPPLTSARAWLGPAEDTQGVVLGDVDGDGDLDLVRGNYGGPTTLYLNDRGLFAVTFAWEGRAEDTRSVALGDVNGDGRPDLVRGNHTGGFAHQSTLYLNTGGTFASTPTWEGSRSSPEDTRSVALGDVNGDGRLDLVCANFFSLFNFPHSTLYLNTGGTFADTSAWFGLRGNTESAALGDVDGDGRLDLVLGNNNQPSYLYLNIGGTFAATPAWAGPSEQTRSVALGDLDGDGDLDLICGNAFQPATVYRNTGGVFESSGASTVGRNEETFGVTLGDVDGDGDLDVVRGNNGGANVYLNESGSFGSEPDWSGPSEPTRSVAVGDVNGDGRLDLVRGNWLGAASLYLNKCPWAAGQVPARHLPNNAAHLRWARAWQADLNLYQLTVTAFDAESDPLWIVGEYQFEGSPVWHPTNLGGGFRAGPLTTSATGIEHQLSWDITHVPPDRRNVVIRLRALSNPQRAGVIQFIPSYLLNVGRIEPARISTNAQGDPGGRYPEGRAIPVTVSLPAGASLVSGELYYRAGGAAQYQSLALGSVEVAPGTSLPGALIPASAVGPRGVEYWVRVQTATRELFDPPWDPEADPRTLQTYVANVSEGEDHAALRYRMVSVPLDVDLGPNGTLDALLSDQPEFGPYDPTRWRCFRYVPGIGYVELSTGASGGAMRPEPGRAFWLIARSANRIHTAPVFGLSTRTDRPFRLRLEQGWNQIGNPFLFPVAWPSPPEGIEPPKPWGENEQTYLDTVSVLLPFEGYFVCNNTQDPVDVLILPDEVPTAVRTAAPRVAASGADPGTWSVQIAAVCDGARDLANEAGVAPDARDGRDRLDRTEPPAVPGTSLSLYFVQPDGARRTVDVRSPIAIGGDPLASGRRWTFDVAWSDEESFTPPNAAPEVRLSFTGLDHVPEGLEVWLLDRTLERLIDLRQQPWHVFLGARRTFVSSPDEARFELLIGTAAYLAAARQGLSERPRLSRLVATFPNPALGAAVIRFETARAGLVRLALYDVAGRRVATLLDEVRDAGRYELAWAGPGQGGAGLPPGIYTLRLIAPDRTDLRRIAKLR